MLSVSWWLVIGRLWVLIMVRTKNISQGLGTYNQEYAEGQLRNNVPPNDHAA
jgi:hypothetical protein